MYNVNASPLHFASNKGHTTVVDLLLDHHANASLSKSDGRTVRVKYFVKLNVIIRVFQFSNHHTHPLAIVWCIVARILWGSQVVDRKRKSRLSTDIKGHFQLFSCRGHQWKHKNCTVLSRRMEYIYLCGDIIEFETRCDSEKKWCRNVVSWCSSVQLCWSAETSHWLLLKSIGYWKWVKIIENGSRIIWSFVWWSRSLFEKAMIKRNDQIILDPFSNETTHFLTIINWSCIEPSFFVSFLNSKTTGGITPLHAALSKANLETSKMLLDYGASYMITLSSGHTVTAAAFAEMIGNPARLVKTVGDEKLVHMITRLDKTPIVEWTVDDVAYFISMRCQDHKFPSHYSLSFRKAHVDGIRLLQLNDTLGIPDKNHWNILVEDVHNLTRKGGNKKTIMGHWDIQFILFWNRHQSIPKQNELNISDWISLSPVIDTVLDVFRNVLNTLRSLLYLKYYFPRFAESNSTVNESHHRDTLRKISPQFFRIRIYGFA